MGKDVLVKVDHLMVMQSSLNENDENRHLIYAVVISGVMAGTVDNKEAIKKSKVIVIVLSPSIVNSFQSEVKIKGKLIDDQQPYLTETGINRKYNLPSPDYLLIEFTESDGRKDLVFVPKKNVEII